MPGKIWWNNIIKTNLFIEYITDTILGGKSIMLFLPNNLPWRNEMEDRIEEKLRIENAAYAMDIINCPDVEPGEFLLEKYCKKEKRASYRHGIGYAKFLANSNEIVLNSRYVWLKDIPENRFDEWAEFVTEYNKELGNKVAALFILEAKETAGIYVKNRKGMEKISFKENVSIYDINTFCALLSSEYIRNDAIKPYMADLVSSMCKDDIELCAECIRHGEDFFETPYEKICDITQNSWRSDYSNYDIIPSKDEVERKIWESQLKFLFPMIENYRADFVIKHKDALEKILPVQDAYGNEISAPEDLEVGMLLCIVGRGELMLPHEDHDALHKYRDFRNRLAHMETLSADDIRYIINDN